MIHLLSFTISFIIMFALYYFIFLRKKIRANEYEAITEIGYLIVKFKLKKAKLQNKKICYIVALINSFIIATISSVMSFINLNYIWKIFIAFGMLIGLIYVMYEFMGRILVRKGYDIDD